MRRLVLILLAACGGDHVGTATADAAPRVITSDQRITLGGVIEGMLDGGAGDAVHIALSSPAPFDWNLHTHVGGTQVIHGEAQQLAADYTYVPTETSTWNLTILDNGSTPITVHVELSLYGGMQWSGF